MQSKELLEIGERDKFTKKIVNSEKERQRLIDFYIGRLNDVSEGKSQ